MQMAGRISRSIRYHCHFLSERAQLPDSLCNSLNRGFADVEDSKSVQQEDVKAVRQLRKVGNMFRTFRKYSIGKPRPALPVGIQCPLNVSFIHELLWIPELLRLWRREPWQTPIR